MKLSLPPALRLDRAALLRDVRALLAERRPDLAAVASDPTSPAWILLEQCAWMVEQLSEQLDAWPLAALQTFVSLMGGQRSPARPALGLVVVSPREAGPLLHPPDRPAPWRFLSAQTETRDLLEFSLAELSAPVRPASFAGWWTFDQDALWSAGAPVGREGLEARPAPRARVGVFDQERVVFRLSTTSPDDLVATLEKAAAVLDERRVGWLSVRAYKADAATVNLELRLDLARAFAGSAPGGLAPGGDLLAEWGTLDDSTWTPPVRIADLPTLPSSLRGRRPMPGPTDGSLLLPNVPTATPVAGLLLADAMPLPANVVSALWRTLVNADLSLAPLRPVVRRELPSPPAEGEPRWVAAALQGQGWAAIARPGGREVLHVQLPPRTGEGPLRLGLASRGASLPNVEIFALDAEVGLIPAPLQVRPGWQLPLPDRAGGLQRVHALDVEVPAGATGLLVAVDGPINLGLLNPVLIINAPPVSDGREVRIERAVPEAVSLLHEDIVSPAVMERLLEQPLPLYTAQVLRRLPLASFAVEGQEPMRDLAGAAVDASDGEVILGAPDARGALRNLRPGTTVTLSWYRRTDGKAAEVEPGAITYVEQPPRTRPALLSVSNPLGTWYAADRETEAACRDRLFAPTVGLPVLPGDWERVIRGALGEHASGWLVRVWGHAERTLMSHSLWPGPDDAEAAALADALETAGPGVLLVALGPPDARLSSTDLDWARSIIHGLVAGFRGRVPALEAALVTRLWGLTWREDRRAARDADPRRPALPPLPCFEASALPDGLLLDADRREARPHRSRLWLNAVVIAAEDAA